MTSAATLLNQRQGIPVDQIRKLDVTLTAVPLSDAFKAQMQEMRERALMMDYSRIEGPPDTIYAEIKRNGQTIAKIYNSGCIESSNAMGGSINSILARHDTQLSGPNGAQERAEILAKALGGKVEKTSTALSQGAWEATPKQHLVTDWDALRRDPRLAGNYRTSPDTLLHAQLFAEPENAA